MNHPEAHQRRDDTVSRRSFLKTGIAGGTIAAVFPLLATDANGSGQPGAIADVPPFDLDEVTLSDLQQGMQAGTHTARSITEKYLERIKAIDREGPALRSVIELNPDALSLADALDKERKEKGPRGPLHGIPLLIKDNIDTADGMATTAGSLALVGSKPPEDAFLVRRLRAAGAVILGKTNLSEWANIRSSRSTSGWSGRGGLTRNPHALDRNTSGSSSGSAVAVAASLCAGAIGTETDGSIVSPSSCCGIVGLKPTVGLVSRTGIIPISHTQDTAGPMTRTVRDAAIMLGAIAGVDREDATTNSRGRKAADDYTRYLDADGLRGRRLGIVRKYFGFHDGVDSVMKSALDALVKAGAVCVDPVEIPSLGKFDDSESLVFHYELKADLNAYLARLGQGAPVHSLKEIIAFNERNKRTEMPFFGQDIFIKSEAKGPLSSTEYRAALKNNIRLTRDEGIDAVMQKHKLDALVGPTGGPAWVTDLVNGDHFSGESSSLAAVAGYPSITVPAGTVFGLPVGISFFGRAWSEPVLLSIAYSFEQATKARKSPRFLATCDTRG
jgi:amidase